jgi:hypothetical protein
MDPLRLTRKIGFLQATLPTSQANLVAWLKETGEAGSISIEAPSAVGSLAGVLRSLLPLTIPEIERRLLVPTDSPWTAYLDNFKLGTDPSAIAYLARRMKCLGVHVVAHDEAVSLALYGPQNDPDSDNTIRSIRIFRELDKWMFRESGKPLPFEETKSYRAARVEDRFTVEMLERDLKELGIRAFATDFYRPAEASLIATRTKRAP